MSQADIASRRLILLGNAESHGLIKRVLPDMPLTLSLQRIRLGDETYSGESLGVEVIYPNPLNTRRYVVIIGASDLTDFQLIERHLALKGWADLTIWDSRDLTVRGTGILPGVQSQAS